MRPARILATVQANPVCGLRGPVLIRFAASRLDAACGD